MTESSLSLGWANFKAAVGFELGYGSTAGSWSTAQTTEIEGIVQSGIRRVYYPPAISGGIQAYEWSWLRPSATLSIVAAYTTGTVGVSSGVVTLASGTFPTWAADGDITITGYGTYTVSSRDGDTQVTLDDTSVDVDSGTSYSLGRYVYTLPDAFHSIIGTLHYSVNDYLAEIRVIPLSQLLELRAGRTLAGDAYYTAIRPQSSDGSSGQRWEALFYPTPDTARTLNYAYEAYASQLSDSYPYPLGGMQMSELYLESCLAVAEVRSNGEPGPHTQEYIRLLADAVSRDKKRAPRRYGYIGHYEMDTEEFRRGYTGSTYSITYKGEAV